MMVDPAGGPYINLGYDMGIIDKSFDGMTVEGFISNDDGYEIIINKELTDLVEEFFSVLDNIKTKTKIK